MHESRIGQKLDELVFDKIFERLTPFRDQAELDAYFAKLTADFDEDKALLSISFGLFSAIDTKTAALLTHISVLIAAVAIFYAAATPETTYKHLLGAELLAYLVATLLCLRCIRFSIPRSATATTHRLEAYQEIVKRRTILTLASDITIVSTVFLMLLLVLHAFF